MHLVKIIAENVKLSMDDFCERTVINGAKYLHSSRSQQTRKFWRFVLSTLAIISFIIIDFFYGQYKRNSLISVVEYIPEGVAYNFPSFFICPNDIWRNDKVKEFAYNLKEKHELKMQDGEIIKCIKMYTAITHLSKFRRENCIGFIEAIQKDGAQVNLTEIFITSSDVVGDCIFKGSEIACKENFIPFFTGQGLCFVFNNFHTENNLQREVLSRETKNRILVENEAHWDFHIQVRLPETTTKFFVKNNSGMVTLRDFPDEIWRNNSTRTILSFKIQANRATDELLQIPKEKRNCLTANEFPSFENYNNPINQELYIQEVCIVRCHENEILQSCNCSVRLLESLANFSIPKCTVEQFDCVLDLLPNQNRNPCAECPADCVHIKYEAEKQLWSHFGERRFPKKAANGNETSYEEIVIGLKSWPVYRFRTTIIYNIFDLLVSFAGVASFFFGFSFVAVNEMVYFAVVRCLYNFPVKKKSTVEQMRRGSDFPGPINLSLVPCKKL